MPQTVHVSPDSVYMGTGKGFINKHVFSDGTSNTVIGGTMDNDLFLVSFFRSKRSEADGNLLSVDLLALRNRKYS